LPTAIAIAIDTDSATAIAIDIATVLRIADVISKANT